jgi:hypothetical protein
MILALIISLATLFATLSSIFRSRAALELENLALRPCSIKTRYDEPSIRISIVITDREHIFRWGRTRRSHERFSRRKWDRSWRYRKSGDCTTATNDGPPKEPKSSVLRVASVRTLEICRTVLRCTRVPARISFTRLEQVHELLEPVWLGE